VVGLLGSAILVYWTSTSRPLWVDEEMLLLNVRDRGFLQLAGALWLDQSAPYGWLLLERLILVTFGGSEPAVRLLPIAFGAGTLAVAAWIGRRRMTATGAAVFVALCALAEWPVFFTLELKHYSADMCGSLVVPAAAAWALDGVNVDRPRRVLAWWILAATIQWVSNGALFVTPLCAVVLSAAGLRSRRTALALLTGAAIWMFSFAINYALVLRHAAANEYLHHYWAFAFPPLASGGRATLEWIVHQIGSFARKPGSTGMPAFFWLAWIGGVSGAIGRRRSHGWLLATVPLSALALAMLHVVPPFERLAMWIVPSMYAGLGYAVDEAARMLAAGARRRRIGQALVGAAMLALSLAAPLDIIRRGVAALRHRPQSNYGLDDRRSIAFLLSAHRAGDAVLTTHFGLAGLWWYGKIAVNDAARGTRLADGSPIYEVSYAGPEQDCDIVRSRASAILSGSPRAAVYLGFRMNVEPVGFDDLVLREFARSGALVAYKEYVEESRLALFDWRRRSSTSDVLPLRRGGSPLPGCVSVRPAARW
jgi:hypothetical protein